MVYLQTGYKPDLSNGGSEASPNPRKETALCLMRARPELKGKLLVEGTWDFDIVPELAPRPNDIVVLKTRYSGFAGTTLDSVLRVREIRYLFFVGIATNVCVESTLRDAYFHEYWPVLVTDATMQAGPRTAHEATIFNVESFFGWTLDSKSLIDSLAERGCAAGDRWRSLTMDRTVLLALVMIGVMAGCGRRDDDASAPATTLAPHGHDRARSRRARPGGARTRRLGAGRGATVRIEPAAPADVPVAEEAAAEGDGCNAEPVQNLVGEVYTPELGEQARVTAGARVERALRPGQIVTMEFRSDRLSFTLDEKGRISQVSCG